MADRKAGKKSDKKADKKANKIEFSPAMPIPPVFDVEARIKTLPGYLDPSNPNYQPERQHVNIRAVIKLYEEGKIDGLHRTTVIDGKIAPHEKAFTAKSRSWTEVLLLLRIINYTSNKYYRGWFTNSLKNLPMRSEIKMCFYIFMLNYKFIY
jgi:hypothetical protein